MFILDILEEEIKKAKQNPEKMKMGYESRGSICIDVSKMEYVENKNESNRG